jgi:hypothetical protein
MKIGISGFRHFRYMGWVESFVRELPAESVIITGGHTDRFTGKIGPTMGVDAAAYTSATRRGMTVILVPPDPDDITRVGYKAACILRNQTIVDMADEVYAFWSSARLPDGRYESRGTHNTILRAIAAKKLRGVFYQHGPVSMYRVVDGKLMAGKFPSLERVPPLYRMYGRPSAVL